MKERPYYLTYNGDASAYVKDLLNTNYTPDDILCDDRVIHDISTDLIYLALGRANAASRLRAALSFMTKVDEIVFPQASIQARMAYAEACMPATVRGVDGSINLKQTIILGREIIDSVGAGRLTLPDIHQHYRDKIATSARAIDPTFSLDSPE